MSKNAKIALGIVLALMALCLSVCGGGYLWFKANKDDLKAEGTATMDEAEAFGAKHTQDECITESLSRLDKCGAGQFAGIKCKSLASIYLRQCLGKASPSPDVCKGVPRTDDIMASVKWQMKACLDAKRPNNQDCTRLMQAVQRHCHP